MPINASERRFIDEVSLTLPWGLVEQFAKDHGHALQATRLPRLPLVR